jgi:DNA-binding NarL/FixJ family response regulator
MSPTPYSAPLTLLLVEDNANFAASVKGYLAAMEHISVVGHAVDAPQAVARVIEFHPDLVLLDIALGHGNGFDVARCLSTLEHAPAVIFLTMHDQLAYRNQASALGALALVGKDRFVQDLTPLLHTLVARHKAGESLVHPFIH